MRNLAPQADDLIVPIGHEAYLVAVFGQHRLLIGDDVVFPSRPLIVVVYDQDFHEPRDR